MVPEVDWWSPRAYIWAPTPFHTHPNTVKLRVEETAQYLAEAGTDVSALILLLKRGEREICKKM